jgi:hypothetical protein
LGRFSWRRPGDELKGEVKVVADIPLNRPGKVEAAGAGGEEWKRGRGGEERMVVLKLCR